VPIPFRTPLARLVDVLGAPLTLFASLWLAGVRRGGVRHMPVSRRIFGRVGVFPIRRHYYEPLFDPRDLVHPLDQERPLPGVDLNVAGQLALLAAFPRRPELDAVPTAAAPRPAYYYDNGSFMSGDAEYLYQVVRHFKPRRFVEVGSGMSTLLVRQAIADEQRADPAYACRHVCIEPYENPWLASLDVELVRERVEKVPRALFTDLGADDVLFIDSSHVVRPQGDVVTEYLDILPRLRPGVLVHVHDIFTPRDYPDAWVRENMWLWTEQYLVEAFLSHNDRFEIVGALNYLARHHAAALGAACPQFAREAATRDPGSLWLRVRGDAAG
jgi:predicted O-methyltransferase YrrM